MSTPRPPVHRSYLPSRTRRAAAPLATPRHGGELLAYQGGRTLPCPELVSFYWGAFSQSAVDGMQDYLRALGAAMANHGAPPGDEFVTQQYGIVGATVGAHAHRAAAPQVVTEARVQSELRAMQSQKLLPPFRKDRVFLIFLGGVEMDGHGTEWCAYHGDWDSEEYFAICPFPSGPGCHAEDPIGSWQSITSHEVFEAATDPVAGLGWTFPGEEGADGCSWSEAVLSFGLVQGFHDNRSRRCAVWVARDVAEPRWVRSLVRDLLGRDPRDAELEAHLSARRTGRSAQDVARDVLLSPERCAAEARRLYPTLLDRATTPKELTAWTNALGLGTAPQDITCAILDSDESKAAYPGNAAFVTHLYRCLLGQAPDPAARIGWIRKLDGGAKRRDVIYGFLRSRQYADLVVRGWYLDYLRRAPVAPGLEPWVAALRAGRPSQEVLAAFLSANEYRDWARGAIVTDNAGTPP